MVETKSHLICQHFKKVRNFEGFLVCRNCGMVFEKEIRYDPNPSDNFKNNHISGSNTLRDIWRLGTIIPMSKKDIMLYKDISARHLYTYSRLSKIHKYCSAPDNQRKRFINLLNDVGRTLFLPDYILDGAILRFNKIIDLKAHIINRISLLIFCLWDSIRCFKYRTHFKELLNEFKARGHYASPKLIIRDGSLYSGLLVSMGFPKSTPKQPVDYIKRHIADLLSNKNLIDIQLKKKKRFDITAEEYIYKIQNKALDFLNHFNGYLEKIGNNPLTISACLIYIANLALGDFIRKRSILTLSLIATIVKIPQYTLRDLYGNGFKPYLPITQYKRNENKGV